MTKREMYNAILEIEAVKANADLVEGIKHEIELLDKKSKAERKPTKTQVENERLRGVLIAYLAVAEAPKSIAELKAEVSELAELSTSKIAHLVKPLVDSNRVTRTVVKKVAHYSINIESDSE